MFTLNFFIVILRKIFIVSKINIYINIYTVYCIFIVCLDDSENQWGDIYFYLIVRVTFNLATEYNKHNSTYIHETKRNIYLKWKEMFAILTLFLRAHILFYFTYSI